MEKKVYDHEVMSQLARLYYRLKDDLYSHINQSIPGVCFEDIFQDTILLVSSDPRARNLDDTELKTFFFFRFNMLEFRANKDEASTLKAIKFLSDKTKVTTYNEK